MGEHEQPPFTHGNYSCMPRGKNVEVEPTGTEKPSGKTEQDPAGQPAKRAKATT